jgi:hypothetical protein
VGVRDEALREAAPVVASLVWSQRDDAGERWCFGTRRLDCE